MIKRKILAKLKDEIEINKTDAIGYKRVSDISQVDGASLDTQDKSIVKYCEENKLNLLKIYSDPGKSGLSTTGRHAFLQLMVDVKPGNFVIVYELSRFARDQKDLIDNFRDLVRNKGCTFICLNPHIDSRDNTSDLMVGIVSSLAEQESARTSERVSSNMQRLSEEGKLMSRPPFGFVHDPMTRKYLPDSEQQEIVNKLQLWHLGGVSMNEMSKRLNNDGLGHVMNNNKTKKNPSAKFNPVTIGLILRGYGFLKDDKSPHYTYPERVKTWNDALHKVKIKYMGDNGKIENTRAQEGEIKSFDKDLHIIQLNSPIIPIDKDEHTIRVDKSIEPNKSVLTTLADKSIEFDKSLQMTQVGNILKDWLGTIGVPDHMEVTKILEDSGYETPQQLKGESRDFLMQLGIKPRSTGIIINALQSI